MNKRKRLLMIIICVGLTALFIWVNHEFLKIPPEYIRNLVLSFGWISPFVYIIMFTLRPFVLFPSPLLAIVGGLAFGFWYGFSLTVIGSCLGAVVSFWALRKLGITFGRIPSKPKYDGLREQIDKQGFLILTVLRLLPFVHFDLVTYLSAVSSIRFSKFLVATILGVIPGAFIYCAIGSSVHTGANQIVIWSIILLILFTILPILFRKQLSAMLRFRFDQD